MKARAHHSGPIRSVRITCSNFASSISATGIPDIPMPAFATSRSGAPNARAAPSNSACTEAGSDTSACATKARRPADSTRRRVSSAPSLSVW
jgi:hypothetical protein